MTSYLCNLCISHTAPRIARRTVHSKYEGTIIVARPIKSNKSRILFALLDAISRAENIFDQGHDTQCEVSLLSIPGLLARLERQVSDS